MRPVASAYSRKPRVYLPEEHLSGIEFSLCTYTLNCGKQNRRGWI